MTRGLLSALGACAVTFLMCSVVYPAAVWAVAQLLFPAQANGSLIYQPGGRTIIGSELVAQKFESDRYFHPRPSAVSYKADAAGGSNLGPHNSDLRTAASDRVRELKATAENPAPIDLVTASGSGLDPDISVEAALFQAPRVAAARTLPESAVRDLITKLTNHSGAIIGAPPRVNVLLLNLELDTNHIVARSASR